MKKVVIIGASSGIGYEAARILSKRGCILGLAARRLDRLEEIKKELGTETHVKKLDISETGEAIKRVEELVAEMGGADSFIIGAGVGLSNKNFEWEIEKKVIDINVTGFAAMVNVAFNYLASHGGGRIAGISSVAAVQGNGPYPAYNATKAFVSNYLEGLHYRSKMNKFGITVTDVMPGFVDTPMTKGQKGMFWVSTPERAAGQIIAAMEAGKSRVYVTKRWRFVASIMRHMPDWLYLMITPG